MPTKQPIVLAVTKLTSLKTRNGLAWTGTLTENGTPVARVENRGDGGALWIDWTPSDGRLHGGTTAARLMAHAKTLPPVTDDFGTLPMDLELLLSLLADQAEMDKKLKRLCKGKTVWRVPSDPEGTWQVLAAPLTPARRADLVARYPQIEFANDRFA